MGSMANKLKHKKMLQQSLLHEHPIEVEKLHEKQLTIEKRTSPRKKQHGPPNLPVHETHTEQVEKLYERQELHERQDKRKQVARELNMEETEFTEEQEVQEELNVDLTENNQELGSTEGHDNGPHGGNYISTSSGTCEGGESSNPVDPFEALMGKEHKGRLKLY
ncbi:hypothetical protein Dimus_018184 [Dionaea muscipula]